MSIPKFKHIYGPVHSWRMGMSLGLDPVSTAQKVCNFNCTYCQLGSNLGVDVSLERRVFVPAADIAQELKAVDTAVLIDYLTFSGNGEPTLAANLGQMITTLKAIRPESRVAVITNGTLLGRPDVQADLKAVDLILVKLEAATEATFQALNAPAKGISLKSVLDGIKAFKKTFEGRFALQIMFVEKNKAEAAAIARLALDIAPDEVQLNTPLRPGGEVPLSPEEMARIKLHFGGLNVRSVYEEEKKEYRPFDDGATRQRHGNFTSTR